MPLSSPSSSRQRQNLATAFPGTNGYRRNRSPLRPGGRVGGAVWLALILTLVAVPRAKANFYDEDSNVTVLTTESFNRTLSRDDGVAWFVEFYADWCQTCNALRSTWVKLARIICASPDVAKRARVAAVSCEDYPSVCRGQRIPAYPDIRYYPSDPRAAPITYHGLINPVAVVEWIEMQIGPVPGLRKGMNEKSASATPVRNDKSMTKDSPVYKDSKDLGVTVQDMASSVMYSLEREVFKSNDALSVTKYRTLLDFLDLLGKRFPFEHNRASFHELRDYVEMNRKTTATKWERRLSTFQVGSLTKEHLWPYCQEIGMPSRVQKEHGRSDDNPGLWRRRSDGKSSYYPCGLWLLFHTLSIRTPTDLAVETNRILTNYVSLFFGCRTCVVHFEKMTGGFNPTRALPTPSLTTTNTNDSTTKPSSSKGGGGGAFRALRNRWGFGVKVNAQAPYLPTASSHVPSNLWTWVIHNAVNIRLNPNPSPPPAASNTKAVPSMKNTNASAGTTGESTMGSGGSEVGNSMGVKDYLFPSATECPTCRIDNPEVLENLASTKARAVTVTSQLPTPKGKERVYVERVLFREFGIVWDGAELTDFLAKRYCISGPPDEDERDLSTACVDAAGEWIPPFRKRHNMSGKAAVYIVAAFIGSVLVVSLGSCLCANLGETTWQTHAAFASPSSFARRAKVTFGPTMPIQTRGRNNKNNNNSNNNNVDKSSDAGTSENGGDGIHARYQAITRE